MIFWIHRLLPQQTSLFAVWLLGVSLGLTACTATCLPFMGTWVLGRGGTQLQALRDTALFVSGRILAYALLGAVAAGAGTWLAQVMRGGSGNLVIGFISLRQAFGCYVPPRRTRLAVWRAAQAVRRRCCSAFR